MNTEDSPRNTYFTDVSINDAKTARKAVRFAIKKWVRGSGKAENTRVGDIHVTDLMAGDSAALLVHETTVDSSTCVVIPCCWSNDSYETTRIVVVNVADSTHLELIRKDEYELLDLAREQHGPTVVGAEFLYSPEPVEPTGSVTVESTSSVTLTRYVVMNGEHAVGGTYSTRALALEAAVAYAEQSDRAVTFAVRAVVAAENGQRDLDVVHRPGWEPIKVEVKITVSTPVEGAKVADWTVGFAYQP